MKVDGALFMTDIAGEDTAIAGRGIDDEVLEHDRKLNSIKKSFLATPFELLLSGCEGEKEEDEGDVYSIAAIRQKLSNIKRQKTVCEKLIRWQ